MLSEIILTLFTFIIAIILIILAVKWQKINSFFHETYTYFSIVFVAIYFLEQAIFISASFLYPQYINLLVGFFALVVLSTVALQGVMMESKSKKLAEELSKYHDDSVIKIKEMREEYEKKISRMRETIYDLETDNEVLINEFHNKKKSK
jgi:hypothetical protein